MKQSDAALSLLFQPGERPSVRDVELMLDSDEEALRSIQLSHRPDEDEGWVELLSSGLTFDLVGLAPARFADSCPAHQAFGLPENISTFEFEAISLRLGPHISAGNAMIPIIRVMMALSAQLAEGLSARVICWHPSGSWMEPGYFRRIVESWLFGGAFPALGLTNIEQRPDGTVVSKGLDFFIGQELQVMSRRGERTAETVKLAVRTIDHLVRHGPMQQGGAMEGPDDELLQAEVSRDGRTVRILRERV